MPASLPTLARALLFGTGVEIYLHPGQLEATRAPVQLGTLLGSCVAVCLWAEGEGGGMNHYVLPYGGPSGDLSGKHGPRAIQALLQRLDALGLPAKRLTAKVFGGASPLCNSPLGRANAQLALRLLSEARIPVVAQDVGGTRGRRIAFNPRTGAVLVRML